MLYPMHMQILVVAAVFAALLIGSIAARSKVTKIVAEIFQVESTEPQIPRKEDKINKNKN